MHRRMVERMKTVAVCLVLCMVATQSIGLQAFAWKITKETIDDHNFKFERMQMASKGGIKRCSSDALEVWVHKEYGWETTANTELATNSCQHVLGLHDIYVKFLNKKFGMEYKKKLLMFISPPDNSGVNGYVIPWKSNVIYIKAKSFELPQIHLHELTHIYQMERGLTVILAKNNRFFLEGLALFAEWEFREQFDFKNQNKYFQQMYYSIESSNYNDKKKSFFNIRTFTTERDFINEFIQKPLRDMMRAFDKAHNKTAAYAHAFSVLFHFEQLARKRNKNFKIHNVFTQSMTIKIFGENGAKKFFEQMTTTHLGMSFEAFEKSFQRTSPHTMRNVLTFYCDGTGLRQPYLTTRCGMCGCNDRVP